MLVSYHKLAKTNVTLEQLYNGTKQIRVHLTASNYIYTLVTVGRDKEPDFMLSTFAGNYYCRSRNGQNRVQYKSIEGIEKAVKRLVHTNIDSGCVISFSLSDEIDLM